MELLGDPGIGGGWWQVICFAVVLALWEAQNGIVFENTDMQIMGIVESVKIKSWNWLRVRKKGFAKYFGLNHIDSGNVGYIQVLAKEEEGAGSGSVFEAI